MWLTIWFRRFFWPLGRAWEPIKGRPRCEPGCWVSRGTRVEDHYRARLRDPEPLADQETDSDATPAVEPLIDELLDRDRLERKTKRVLEELPEAYSAVLLWRYWEHRSAQEMAQLTGKTVKAVERMLARARDQFKRRWQDE